MRPERDLMIEMHGRPVDHETAEQLLAGRVDPGDAPQGYAGVARLVRTAQGPALPGELDREAAMVSLMAAAATVRLAPQPPKEALMRGKLLPFKLAAASIVGAVGFATAAAAMSVTLGSHPTHARSSALAQFSNSPTTGTQSQTAGDTGGNGGTDSSGSNGASGSSKAATTTTPVGPVTGMKMGHATFGLCTAFLAIYRTGAGATSKALTSTAFKTLETTLGTSTSAATAIRCQTVVTNTKPGATSTTPSTATATATATSSAATGTSHPSATTHPTKSSHPTATTHPGASTHPTSSTHPGS